MKDQRILTIDEDLSLIHISMCIRDRPLPEWGALISAGKDYISSYPHISGFPVIFIFVTVTGFNLLGDGLRDVLDPRM